MNDTELLDWLVINRKADPAVLRQEMSKQGITSEDIKRVRPLLYSNDKYATETNPDILTDYGDAGLMQIGDEIDNLGLQIDPNNMEEVGGFLSTRNVKNAQDTEKALADLWGGAQNIPSDPNYRVQVGQALEMNRQRMGPDSFTARDYLEGIGFVGSMVGLGAMAGLGGATGALSGTPGLGGATGGTLAGDWGAAAGKYGMGLAEGSGSTLGAFGAEGVGGTLGSYGAEAIGGTVASSGSIWDSIGSTIAKGAGALGSALTGGGNLPLGGLISGATNLYGANETQNLLDDIKKGSDPFAGQRENYFAPVAESAGLLGKSQDLAYRGLSDPTYWDQSWLNDAAERAGSDTQKKLASQGYNFSTNTINNMSKNMRDTRAQYILPGQQNLINNIGAQAGATRTLGDLAGAQFNIGQAAPTLFAGQTAINSGINNAAGNVAAGFGTTPSAGGPTMNQISGLFGNNSWGQTQPNYLGPSAWGEGTDPFELGAW